MINIFLYLDEKRLEEVLLLTNSYENAKDFLELIEKERRSGAEYSEFNEFYKGGMIHSLALFI